MKDWKDRRRWARAERAGSHGIGSQDIGKVLKYWNHPKNLSNFLRIRSSHYNLANAVIRTFLYCLEKFENFFIKNLPLEPFFSIFQFLKTQIFFNKTWDRIKVKRFGLVLLTKHVRTKIGVI